MAKTNKKRTRGTLVSIQRDVIASQKRQLADIVTSNQSMKIEIDRQRNHMRQLIERLDAANNPTCVMDCDRPLPIKYLTDHALLNHLHACERDGLTHVEGYGQHGASTLSRRGLTSPVYPVLIDEAIKRGLIGATRNRNEQPRTMSAVPGQNSRG